MATGWFRDSTAWRDAEGFAQPPDGTATPPQFRTAEWMCREASMACKKWDRIFPASDAPEWLPEVERVRAAAAELRAALYDLVDDRPMIVTSPTTPDGPEVRYGQTRLL